MQAAQVTQVCTDHGEGAVWASQWGGLRFVDMMAGDVLSLQADGRVTRQSVGDVAACLRPRTGGGMVVGRERGFALFGPDGELDWSVELWSTPDVRMNDGACDPDGRFWCGSMAYDQSHGAGSLYRLDPDRSTTLVQPGLTIPNGLGFSPDGALAYHTDSPTGRITVYHYDRGQGLHAGRPFVEIDADDGVPDGLTVDADGNVWTAVYNGGQVRCYAASGELVEVVQVPARQTTSCTFGGPDLRDLYITTSREGMGDSAEPGAGALFVARGLSVGQPVLPFAG
jgi:sugar lactone lactonase YvrE